MFRSIVLISAFALAGLVPVLDHGIQEKQEPQKRKQDPIVIPSDDENSIARRDFMRTKMMFTQSVFQGLTTGNFAMIKRAVKEIEGITKAAHWVEIDNERYRKLTEEFNTTVDRLAEAAESENIDAIALRYYSMSTSCIDCHKHIRQAKYEF
ncbi:MAG: hypothetical protein AAFN77_12560 [Planctomycetota bacterium]